MVDSDMTLLSLHDEEGNPFVSVFVDDDKIRHGDVRKIEGREYWVLGVCFKTYEGQTFRAAQLQRIAWN